MLSSHIKSEGGLARGFTTRVSPDEQCEGWSSHEKCAKTLWCRKVGKLPKPPIVFQAADSDGNMNLKIWRVYPLQFASLEIEANSAGATGNPARAFFIGVRRKRNQAIHASGHGRSHSWSADRSTPKRKANWRSCTKQQQAWALAWLSRMETSSTTISSSTLASASGGCR